MLWSSHARALAASPPASADPACRLSPARRCRLSSTLLDDTARPAGAPDAEGHPYLHLGGVDEEQLLRAKLDRLLAPVEASKPGGKGPGGVDASRVLAPTLPQRRWGQLQRSLGVVSAEIAGALLWGQQRGCSALPAASAGNACLCQTLSCMPCTATPPSGNAGAAPPGAVLPARRRPGRV